MQTFIENREYTSAGKEPQEFDARSGREGSALDSKAQNEYSFLNEVYHSIPSISLPVCEVPFGQTSFEGRTIWNYNNQISIDALENITFLEKCVHAYCKAYGEEFDFRRSGNPLEDMSNLINLAQSVCPSNHEIVIDYRSDLNMVAMIEYAPCEYDSYTLFFLPVSFVNKVPEELKSLVEKAVSVISVTNDLLPPEEHFDLAYSLGLWDNGEGFEETKKEDPERYEELMDLVNDYLSGDIHKLIRACNTYCEDGDLIKEEMLKILPKYADTKIGELLTMLVAGLDLADEGCWKQYAQTPNYCSIEDYGNDEECTLDQSRLFALVYDLMDEAVETATDCINSEAGAMCIEEFYDYRWITPETDKEFVASDFLKRWSLWFSNIINLILSL